MVYLIKYQLPNSSQVRREELEAHDESAALEAFHKKHGWQARVISIEAQTAS